MTAQITLLSLYILAGPVAWAALWWAMHAGRRRMSLLRRPHPPLPEDPPLVSVLVPAKDEGQRIRACLQSILSQTYPHLEVLAIDDRSTDQTGAVMDELAAAHDNLRVLHIKGDGPPPGWTGKCNALHRGVAEARGQWLLLVDSDVTLENDAVAASIARCIRRGSDMLSLMPRLECHTLWESVAVPLAGAAVSMMYLVSLTNKDQVKTAFGNGQYLLIRREVYDAIGGHEAVSGRFCEDIAIAQRAKAAGYKVRLSWGQPWAAVRMYSSLRQIISGWARIFFAAAVGRPGRIVLGLLFTIVCGLSAYAAAIWGIWQAAARPAEPWGWLWLGAAVVHLALITALLWRIYRWSGNRGGYALLFPLGALLLLWTFLRALWMCASGRVEWRGTHYVKESAVRGPLSAVAAGHQHGNHRQQTTDN